MSIALMTLVWERPDLDPYERLVMLSLADHAGEDGTCYPSISRLCARTGMKERGVQTVLKRLAARGEIVVVPNAGRRGANLYVIPSTPAPDAPRTGCTPAPDAPLTPASGAPRIRRTPAPHVVNPRTPCGGTPAPGAPEPSLNRQEPSEEEEEEEECARDASFFADVLVAAGYNPADVVPTHWMPPKAELEVLAWLDLPGMTEDLAIRHVRESTRAKGPPNGPRAFQRGLEALSSQITAPPLTPAQHTAPRRGAPSRGDRLDDLADQLKARLAVQRFA